MRKICAWCAKELSPSPADDGEVAHGICLLCKQEFIGETWLSLKESVSRIPFPVLFVDGDYKVDAVSATAAKLVAGNAKDETKPLTGVVIGCVNSQLPGGCGHSAECVGCILRNTATATFADEMTRNGMSSTHKLLSGGSVRDVIITFSVERISAGVLIYVENIRDRSPTDGVNQRSA